MATIVDVKDLSIVFQTEKGVVPAVNHVDFCVNQGESVGIVGESGSGKSTIAFGLFDSVPSPGKIESGEITYNGNLSIRDLEEEKKRQFYWSKISMVFQAAQNTLNPILRIQNQIEDIAKAHRMDKKKAVQKAIELFETMYLDAKRVLKAYPHELSGGMKQRVSIALALLLEPKLVVLDEPTTALDVISQAAVLQILDRVRKEKGISLVFITHDISVIAEIVDRVIVMYAGKIVETGPVQKIITNPSHPYTQGLIASIPPLVGDLQSTHGLQGQPADTLHLPQGCAFASRCRHVLARCHEKQPPTIQIDHQSEVACYLYEEGRSDSA
nr:ABC transporter ATP-binding protein [Bacilli bacterium]